MPGPIIQNPEIPWWADPKGSSVMDPLYITLARKAAGLMGVDNPTSNIMGAASGGPLGEPAEEVGGAARKLANFLNRGKLQPSEAINPASTNIGGVLSPPLTFTEMYNKMIQRVPEAANLLMKPDIRRTITRAPGLPSTYIRQAAFRNIGKQAARDAMDAASLDLPRASGSSLDDLLTTAATTTQGKVPYSKPPLSGKWGRWSGRRPQINTTIDQDQ